MHLSDILDTNHVKVNADASSKKRLLEDISSLISKDIPNIDAGEVFNALLSRERLGSTGIGAGVAIPHARLNGITTTQGCLFLLKEPIDYDAIDNHPVDIVFALIVPSNATDEHLALLATLAEIFNSPSHLDTIRNTQDAPTLYKTMIGYGAM